MQCLLKGGTNSSKFFYSHMLSTWFAPNLLTVYGKKIQAMILGNPFSRTCSSHIWRLPIFLFVILKCNFTLSFFIYTDACLVHTFKCWRYNVIEMLWKSCRESIIIIFEKYEIDVCDNHVTAECPLSKICLLFFHLVSGLEKVFVSLIMPPTPLPRGLGPNYCNMIKVLVNPFTPWNFAEKCFEACRTIFWSLSGNKELKHTKKPFTGRALQGLLFPMQNISFWSSGMCVASDTKDVDPYGQL